MFREIVATSFKDARPHWAREISDESPVKREQTFSSVIHGAALQQDKRRDPASLQPHVPLSFAPAPDRPAVASPKPPPRSRSLPSVDPPPPGKKSRPPSFVALEEEQRQQSAKSAPARTRSKAQPFEQVFKEEEEKKPHTPIQRPPSGFAPIPLAASGFYLSKTPIPDFSVSIRPPQARSVW
jgi:hypothetical protein